MAKQMPHDTEQEQARRLGRARCAFVLLLLVAMAAGAARLLFPGAQPLPPGISPAQAGGEGRSAAGPTAAPTPPSAADPHATPTPSPPSGALPPSGPAGAGEAGCPLRLGGFCHTVEALPSAAYQSWRGYSQLSCDQAAEQVLLALRDDGWTLEEHGYLDLYQEAWGCIVSRPGQGEVLMVTVAPLHKYEPSGQGNPMTVGVIRLTASGIEDKL